MNSRSDDTRSQDELRAGPSFVEIRKPPDKSIAGPPDEELPASEKLRQRLGGYLRAAWHKELPLQTETSYFILVNVLDFFLTYMLFATAEAYEANPVADYFLRHWGIEGMLAFKLTIVAFVCILSQLVARSSLAKARFVLYAGIVVVGIVVLYSGWLLAQIWQ
jgi:hypothetical protein